jgi:ParB-like chromosome segregation protein Spo0J
MARELVKIADLDLSYQDPEYINQVNDPEGQDLIKDIAATMRRREKIEPIIVYRDGKTLRLFDGFHRVEAAKSVGRKRLEAEIRIGDRAMMAAESKRGWDTINADNARVTEHQRKPKVEVKEEKR